MKWFKHDSDASSDAKIKKLLIRYGAVGYAVYFHCLELIAGNVSTDNITFELEHDSEVIADNLRIRGTNDKSGMEVVEEIMRYIVELELFENYSGKITCMKMVKRLDSSMTGNSKFRKMISDAKNYHDSIVTSHDINTESHDTVMTNHDSVMNKNRLEEKRIDKNINTIAQTEESVSAVIILPQIGGKEFPVMQEQIDVFKNAYPAVSIMAELNKMKAWLLSNKKNQKKDVMRFVNNWLARAQDSAIRPSNSYARRVEVSDKWAHEKTGDTTAEILGRKS